MAAIQLWRQRRLDDIHGVRAHGRDSGHFQSSVEFTYRLMKACTQ